MNRQLKDFLATRKASEGNSTHTRIGSTEFNVHGGAYHISKEDLEEFDKLYYQNVFVDGKKEYLTEKQSEDGPMAIDLDFRYAHEVERRIHTKENVSDIVCAYLDELKKIFVFDNETRFNVFAFEKPNVNRLSDGSLTKDGIHFIFGLKVDHVTQLAIRDQILALKNPIVDLPLINTWDSVLDEGISKGTTNWQLFGSRKPSNEAYELKYYYEIGFDSSDSECTVNEIDIKLFDISTRFRELSVQYEGNPKFPMNPSFVNSKAIKQKKTAKHAKKNAVVVTDSEDEATEDKKLRNLLMNFIGSRYLPDGKTKRIEHLDKLKIATACKKIGVCNEKLYCEWEGLGANCAYKEIWENGNIDTLESVDLAWGVLLKILREKDKNKYRLWKLDNVSPFPSILLNDGENGLAKFIAPILKEKLVCANEQWIKLDEKTNLWIIISKPHAVVSNHIVPLINDEIEFYSCKRNDADKDSAEEKYFGKMVSNLELKKKEYSDFKKCGNLLLGLTDYLRDDKFREKLDINLYRMPYKDGMLDLTNLKFRKGIRWSDYVTKTLNFNYVGPSTETGESLKIFTENVVWVKEQLKKICNYNDEDLDYYLSFLGYSMTGDASKEQNLWCIKGAKASNGKSVVFEALTKIMSEFVTCFVSDLFEQNYGERHKEIATWNGNKLGWLNETRKGKKQDEAFLKIIADATQLKYKVMYGTSAVMPVTFKLVYVGNHEMKVSADEGIKRRYVHEELNSDFQDHYDFDNFKTLQFRKDKSFGENLQTKYKHAFLHLIYSYSVAYYEEKKLKPYPLSWAKKGAKVMNKNSEFGNWFETNFEIDENGTIPNWEFMALLKFDAEDDIEVLKRKFNYDGKAYAGVESVYCNILKKMIQKKKPKGVWTGFRIKTEDGGESDLEPENE